MTLRDLESLYSDLTPDKGSAFIKSIREAAKGRDINTLQLIGKLEQFVAEFRPEGRRICAAGINMSREDRDVITLHGRIVAALLLVLHGSHSSVGLREYTLLFLQYASAVVRTRYDYLATALDVICYKITTPGIDWHLIQDANSLDFLSYKLLERIRFDRSAGEVFAFQGRGRVYCRDGRLSVCSSEALESGAEAFSICGGRVGVYTRNVRDEKLKTADRFDAGALRAFADTFIRVQGEGARRGSARREYKSGDQVDIQVLGVDQNGNSLECVIVDGDSEMRGTVPDEELIKGLHTHDLIDYLFEQDCIRDAILYTGEDGNSFSIAGAYTNFARKRAEEDFRSGACFQAKAYHINKTWGRINWMTPSGYGGITRTEDMPDVKVGDMAILQVQSIHKQGDNTFINLCFPKYDVGDVRRFSDDDILSGFITTRETILEGREKNITVKPDKGQDTVDILSTILSRTTTRGSSIDAYRHLMVALFLSEMRDDQGSVARLRSKIHFLGQCLSFAQGDRVAIPEDITLSEGEEAVLRLLSVWDGPKDVIRRELHRYGSGTPQGQIADLLLAMKTAEEFVDEVKAGRNAVRSRICEILGVRDSFEPTGHHRKGKYGNVEGHEVEFKSSYVFRNDGRGADIDAQGKGEVFEAVCGFLNADGGVLYLGVNDQGDPILSKDRGLNADKQWLQEHRAQVNRSRVDRLGHRTVGENIGMEGNLDAFVQFLDFEKELYFKDAFWGNITIVVTEDNDAIKFIVEPAEYEVAYLYSDRTRTDGVAYVRDGGRTVPMSRVQKEQRLADLKRLAKEMGFVVTIQEAIDKHQKLIFKDYASGNSGEVKDRYVLPVNLFYNDENVYCYDLDAGKYKQFRLHRIGSIEYSEDTSPHTLPVSEPRQADVFRWLTEDGQRPYHIRLRLDVGAKNYLLEEYSCAEKLPKEEFWEETKNKWILDTHVNGLGAVRRFYLGLADKIEILDTEDSEVLKEECRRYMTMTLGRI